ncbi:MAG: L-methionine (R)-S-oxide reductase [Mariniflexile sp.]|jgi:L-methionine (R)-S-oxide reductase
MQTKYIIHGFLNTFTKTFEFMIFEQLKPQVETIVSNTEKTLNNRLLHICELLDKHIEYYNWVGFYFRNGKKEELILGPYVGASTDHTIIPFGKGICGQVAVSNQNFIVPDVAAQDNYIACSFTVKAEIVIPIFINGENIGQIDIDSNTPDPFTEKDERFLEFVCQQVASMLG